MFRDSLAGTVSLSIAGAPVHAAPAGDVKRIELRMESWGLEGAVDFWIVSESSSPEDALFLPFLGTEPISATVTLSRALDEADASATALTVKGLVVEKSVVERTIEEVAGAPVLQRLYSIRFVDRGQALWRQHAPTTLLVDQSYRQLLDANVPDGVALAHAWSASSATHAVLALGLGVDDGRASFWDFMHWLASKENAAIFHSSRDDSYAIRDAKPTGSSIALERERVASIDAIFPPTRRDRIRVLDAWSEASTRTKDGSNAKAVNGVRTDTLIRSPISSDLDARTTLENARAGLREPEARIALAAFPTAPIVPNDAVTLGEGFSSAIFQSGKTYRAASVRFVAEAEDASAGARTGEPSNAYRIEYVVDAETSSDPVFRHPPFVAPRWPVFVEGKVVSETGEETEGTYQSYTDASTSLDRYEVKIPLFADQKVVVPYEPLTLSGQFYVPAYKDERVLVALDFDRARIVRFLDWRPGARLPLDSQGNHLLFGKKADSQTSVQHGYVDEKPAVKIVRTSGTDKQIVTISDGLFRIETEDEGGS